MFEEFELQLVGILVLINHNIPIAVAGLSSEFRIFIEDPIGKHEQVVKIHKIVFEYVFLICFVNFGCFLVILEFCFFSCDFRCEKRIFVFGDFTGKKRDIEIDFEFFYDRSQEALLVVTVDNDKIVFAPQFFDMKFQKKQTKFMKSTEKRRIGGLIVDHPQCPLTHL